VPRKDTGEFWFEPRYAWISAGIVALIVYGSLYPFRFHPRVGPIGPVQHLLATRTHAIERGDLISNVLLYLPLGLFAAGSLRRLPSTVRAILAGLMGLVLSTAIELAQFFDLSRGSELGDVYANTAGAFVGGVACSLLFRPDWFPRISRNPFVALLVASWLGLELFPYAPVLDLRRYAAIERAFRSPRFPPIDVFAQIVFWLALAAMLQALTGAARSRWILPLAALAVLSFRLVNLVLSPVDVAGAIAAVAAWMVISRWRFRIALIAGLFLFYAIMQALQPFTFLAAPRHFGWVPFLSFIDAPRLSASRSFLEKTFTYGALLWLWIRAGLSWPVATIAVTLLELCLRFAQLWLPGRSAEITDTVMVLVLALVMKLIDVDLLGTKMNDVKTTEMRLLDQPVRGPQLD
jgi:VanZ family protein